MSAMVIHFIGSYGYVAVFLLVFLQEIGVPNPVPNEIVLLFSGSLGASGILYFPYIVLVVITADILGALLLYVVFYRYGKALLAKIPLPISAKKIEQLTYDISKREWWGVFLGRLMPFLRGYAAVVAGVTRMKFSSFLSSIIISALLWSGGFATIGRILGIYWVQAESVVHYIEICSLLLIVGSIVVYMLRSRKHSHILNSDI
jgi:membrane protein DedA with SNARE-associated domain